MTASALSGSGWGRWPCSWPGQRSQRLAWNIDALIGFRVLQGIGGGLMLPILQNLLVEGAGARKLGRIMATVSLPLLLGPIIGPLRTPRPPLVDLRLFKVRSFASSTTALFLAGFGVFGGLLLMPLYYQEIRGQSALYAGLLLALQGVGLLATRNTAGKLTDLIGARPVVLAGVALTLIGTVAYTQVGVHTNAVLLGLSLVVRGAGLGAITIPVTATAYLGLRPDQVPYASTVTRVVQQVGGSFGTAILALILSTQLRAHHADGLPGQATAFGTAFWWSLGFTAIAVIPALALPGDPKDQPRDNNPEAPGAGQTTPAQPTGPELGITNSPANAKPLGASGAP